jgi:hypothetical protein
MARILKDIKAAAHLLARPILLFYALPWLMILLILGTIAQRYIGLYQSQKIFFGSFILWVGYIPLPGAYTTISLIATALVSKLAFKSPVRKHSAGIIIIHISALILLIGGLITAASREEGYMVLSDGEMSHKISDYHDRELAIEKNGQLIQAIAYTQLPADKVITDPQLPFFITIRSSCYQCRAVTRDKADASLRGLAAKFDIVSAPADKEDARNQSGVVFSVGNAGKADGVYLAYQALNQQPEFTVGKNTYQILIRQTERSIPFDIHLIHFEKSEYPGTNVARSYRSLVEVADGALKWNTVIEMNQPLRYRGYTLYQSSFIDNDNKLFTVLAVVKNYGEIFPYLAITAICIGLLVHLGITFSRSKTL